MNERVKVVRRREICGIIGCSKRLCWLEIFTNIHVPEK
jgi:hypothetical protein